MKDVSLPDAISQQPIASNANNRNGVASSAAKPRARLSGRLRRGQSSWAGLSFGVVPSLRGGSRHSVECILFRESFRPLDSTRLSSIGSGAIGTHLIPVPRSGEAGTAAGSSGQGPNDYAGRRFQIFAADSFTVRRQRSCNYLHGPTTESAFFRPRRATSGERCCARAAKPNLAASGPFIVPGIPAGNQHKGTS